MVVCTVFLATLVLASPAAPQAPVPVPPNSTVRDLSHQIGSPPSPDSADASVAGIFRALPGDFLRLGSRDNLLVLGAASLGALAVHHQDARISGGARESLLLDPVVEGGGTVGNGYVQVGAAGAIFIAGHLTSHHRIAEVGADLLEAQAVNGVLTQAIKVTVDRRRPNGGHYSFPSGHTSATFATAAVIGRDFGWRAALPLYAAGAYVAASRVQEHKHYLSDVMVGAALGMASAHAIHVRAGHHAFVLAPVAVPGGAALWLVPSR